MNKETSLGVVTIKFDNPKYNYTTNVSSSTTEAEARKFFVGKMANVGSYPKENMQKVIDIDFSKSDDKMKTGGEVGRKFETGDYVFVPVADPNTKLIGKIANWDDIDKMYYVSLFGGGQYHKENDLEKATKKDYDDYMNKMRSRHNTGYAKGGGVGNQFYVGQSIIMNDASPHFRRLTKDIQRLVRPYYNVELVIEEIIPNKPYNFAKTFVRSSGQKVPFEIKLNEKYIEQYAKGGGVGSFEYSIGGL